MALHVALFSSAKTEWATPAPLFQILHREFSFSLDVCATAANRKCAAYFTRGQDGLRQPWIGTCWMNPPYGRAIGLWVRKAYEESLKRATVVCLLPARTDTRWWHAVVMRAREIRLLKGRLTFVGATAPAPFPSAVAIFDRRVINSPRPHVVGWDWRAAALIGCPAGSLHGRLSPGFLR
jgi:phage N-6-adenine-methyltransferase